jgi:dTDP-4-dehydrorhamnose 3,5-epimerase
MNFLETPIKDLFEIHTIRNGDERGWFMRTFDLKQFQSNISNFKNQWVQMNHSFSSQKYTWRGFHFQLPPYQETKLVRCVNGSVLDYVLDLRRNSDTYLKIFSIELSSDNGIMLYIPRGCAHGFLTLEDNSELVYLHDEFYSPEFESGVKFNDKKINCTLPFEPLIISQRDRNHPNL